MRRSVVNGGKRDRVNQIDRPDDIEEPDERPREVRLAHDRGDGDERQHGGDEVADGGRVCELRGDAGKDGARRKKHQAEVAHGVQQKNGEHDQARLEPRKRRNEIKLGCDREDDRAQHQIDGEDIHLAPPDAAYQIAIAVAS
jgi:hypothetical protein